MREIDLSAKPDLLPINTFLTYGDTRTGKTTLAGSFPRPLFLSDVTEKGYEALRDENWNDEVTPRFEPDVKPIVWGIERESDLARAVEHAKPLVAAKRVLTIVVDSISFYTDMVLNAILARMDKPDMRRAYGELGAHLRNARIKVHGLGVNVVWLALAKHPETDDPVGRPLIPGQQADKFAAGVDYIWHTRTAQAGPNKPIEFEVHTRRYLNYVAGSRLGVRAAQLPEPFRGTYVDFLSVLDYDIDAIRASLPPMSKLAHLSTRPPLDTASASNAPAPSAPKPAMTGKPIVIKRVGT